MKHILKNLTRTSALVLALTSGVAFAQTTVTVPASVSVNNAVTVATGESMNFGTIVAIPNADDSASGTDDTLATTATISPAGVLSASGRVAGSDAGEVSVGAVVDDTAATAARVDISDAVNGALNITITNVTNPAASLETFALGSFVTSFNGTSGTDVRSVDSAFPVTYTSAFGGGTNTLYIGATISGAEGNTYTETGAFTGSFDVVVGY